MECFRLLSEHLAWIEHQFSSGIRDSRRLEVCEGWREGGSKEVRTPELICQIKNSIDKDRRVSIETISHSLMSVYTQLFARIWRCGRFAQSLSKGAQRRSERKTLSWQQGDGRANQFRSRSSWCSGDLRWKLDLLLWPRDLPGGSMLALPDPRRPNRANPPTNFWWSLFLTALAWSTCTGFPLDRQSTRNTMLRF